MGAVGLGAPSGTSSTGQRCGIGTGGLPLSLLTAPTPTAADAESGTGRNKTQTRRPQMPLAA